MRAVDAVVVDAFLGFEGSVPIYRLSIRNKKSEVRTFGGRRLSPEVTHDAIFSILYTVGVDRWDHLVGTPVRVRMSYSKVDEIGHEKYDRWFRPEALHAEKGALGV